MRSCEVSLQITRAETRCQYLSANSFLDILGNPFHNGRMNRKEYLKQFQLDKARLARNLAAGMTYAEIARKMGLSRQAVRNRALRVKK